MAISRYADDHEITGVDRWLFFIFMNSVDAEYLKIRGEENEEAKKTEKSRNPA